MLESLDIVDYVYLNSKKTSVNVIEILKPNFYVKGPDYKNNKNDITNAIKDESKAVKNLVVKLFTLQIQFKALQIF